MDAFDGLGVQSVCIGALRRRHSPVAPITHVGNLARDPLKLNSSTMRQAFKNVVGDFEVQPVYLADEHELALTAPELEMRAGFLYDRLHMYITMRDERHV